MSQIYIRKYSKDFHTNSSSHLGANGWGGLMQLKSQIAVLRESIEQLFYKKGDGHGLEEGPAV